MSLTKDCQVTRGSKEGVEAREEMLKLVLEWVLDDREDGKKAWKSVGRQRKV